MHMSKQSKLHDVHTGVGPRGSEQHTCTFIQACVHRGRYLIYVVMCVREWVDDTSPVQYVSIFLKHSVTFRTTQ